MKFYFLFIVTSNVSLSIFWQVSCKETRPTASQLSRHGVQPGPFPFPSLSLSVSLSFLPAPQRGLSTEGVRLGWGTQRRGVAALVPHRADTSTTPQQPPPSLKLHPHHIHTHQHSIITICMLSPPPALRLLIMLITCPAKAASKMGVFSSRLAPNEASPGPEVYIHTLLNGQILPRCCLHSGPTRGCGTPHYLAP